MASTLYHAGLNGLYPGSLQMCWTQLRFTLPSVCFYVAAVSSEEEQDGVKLQPHRCNLFHDEQLNSFFRRLAWSPDGRLFAGLSS